MLPRPISPSVVTVSLRNWASAAGSASSSARGPAPVAASASLQGPAPLAASRYAAASAREGGINRNFEHRLRNVGRSREGWLVTSSNSVRGGGSSRVLSKAFAANGFIASAGVTIAILLPLP